MRSGLVKQVNDLSEQIEELKTTHAREREETRQKEKRHWRIKFAAFGLLMTILGFIIEELLSRMP